MSDTQTFQPPRDMPYDRLEESLEQWHEHLTRLSPTLSPGEMTKLSRQWDRLRQNFDIACLHSGLETTALQAVLGPLPVLKDCRQDELEMTAEALQLAKKTLAAMLSETKPRAKLLEEALNSDQPPRIRKSLEKLRSIDGLLQTRLLGLDAYIELFQQAETPERDLLECAGKVIEQTNRIKELSEQNAELETRAEEMRRWLATARLKLDRMPISPPPNPDAMQNLSRSGQEDEADRAVMSLFSNREKLKNARHYLENLLDEKENS